jgi:hypothetical protein
MTGTELAVATEAELAELQALQEDEYGDDSLQTPILKIGQPLTKEVAAGDANAGDFINSVLGEAIGTELQFVVAHYGLGRFAVDRDSNRAYVAFGKDPVIPEAWEDLVGAEWVGSSFSEFPDAEEKYKARVNAKEIPWGKGPLVSTTHNFTGFAIVPSLDEGGEPEFQPARLSLKRTDVPAAKKWLTTIRSKRNTALWDFVYDLSTYKKEFTQGYAYLLNVKRARASDVAEKEFAVEIASAVVRGKVTDNSADVGAEKPAEPDAEGGLAV